MAIANAKITGSINIPLEWFREQHGIVWEDPLTTDIHAQIARDTRVERLAHQRFPDLPAFSADPQPCYKLRMHAYNHLVAMAYGAPAPVWMPDSAAFWHHRDVHVWEWVRTVEDVARIDIPDWENIPVFRETVERYHRFRDELFPGRDVMPTDVVWPWTSPVTGASYRLTHFVSFIDMGPVLFGIERFFEILAGEEELADALLDKCVDISCSMAEFFLRMVEQPFTGGFVSFGGDFSSFLSPELYRRYGLGFDRRLLARYGMGPANLHSCGASAHLYETWAEYDNPIVLMQTRGVPGRLRRLRAALPDTFLEITLAPPQFRPGVDRVRDAVLAAIDEVGGRDAAITMILPNMGYRHDALIREFHAALAEYNGEG